MPRHRPHWYRIHVGSCPLCMADKGYRERVYCDVEPRPEHHGDRYVLMPDYETYDWCEL